MQIITDRGEGFQPTPILTVDCTYAAPRRMYTCLGVINRALARLVSTPSTECSPNTSTTFHSVFSTTTFHSVFVSKPTGFGFGKTNWIWFFWTKSSLVWVVGYLPLCCGTVTTLLLSGVVHLYLHLWSLVCDKSTGLHTGETVLLDTHKWSQVWMQVHYCLVVWCNCIHTCDALVVGSGFPPHSWKKWFWDGIGWIL